MSKIDEIEQQMVEAGNLHPLFAGILELEEQIENCYSALENIEYWGYFADDPNEYEGQFRDMERHIVLLCRELVQAKRKWRLFCLASSEDSILVGSF